MAAQRRLEATPVGDVTVVRFIDEKIFEESSLQQLGVELFRLVEEEKKLKLLLNLSNVTFLSSGAIGKLITLEKKLKERSGVLKLSNVRPEILEVFAVLKLDKRFDLKPDEAAALKAF